MPTLDTGTLWDVFSIVVINLVLSGDNAVVIAMAANQLPRRQRRMAMLFGAGAAVGLRVIFTALVAVLLHIPLLQLGGGVVLIWIAYKLLRPVDEAHAVGEVDGIRDAVQTIVLADVVMSLDNILAVGGAAGGELWLLLFGLGLSMPLLIAGSGVLAWAMERVPALIYVGAAILTWTAAEMIADDRFVETVFHEREPLGIAFGLAVTAIVLLAGWRARRCSDRPLAGG